MNFSDDMKRAASALQAWIERAESREDSVLMQPRMAALARDLKLDELMREGGLTGARLSAFLETCLEASHRIQHPASMGHQVSCPHPASFIGGLMDVMTNNPMAIYEMGPAAATVEFAVVNWLLRKAGWEPHPWPGAGRKDEAHAAGVLTHGGSLAQLTALAAARAHADPEAWENGNDPALTVIAPPDAHYSISRAMGILGLGQKALSPAPCDALGRVRPDALDSQIRRLKAEGRRIMAVTANAGCTAAGLYDDFNAIADVCEAHDLWLHIDGAHGAAAFITSRYRHLMDGAEHARSLVWDAHKMLRAPGLCAAVLMRDHRDLDHAFQQKASYLFHDKEQIGFDAISRTVECTKAGIGLKFFTGLAGQGEAALAAYVESRFDLGARAAKMISAHPDFELAVEPQANIVCFALRGLDDHGHLELRKKLLATGRAYITTTEFAGRRWLRLVFMNPETTLGDVEEALALLLELAKNET